jgi:hypothetical protein
VKRLGLAGWAGYGYWAARTRWHWGLKLYLVAAPDGMHAACCPASPKPGEREVARDLLAHAARSGALRPGFTPIGDKGFARRDFEHLVTAGSGLYLVRPDRRDETPRHGSIDWIRQWIESVNDTLKGQLDLERHGGRTPGVCTPESPSGCWPWPPASGTTGQPANPSNARWLPPTTELIKNRSSRSRRLSTSVAVTRRSSSTLSSTAR